MYGEKSKMSGIDYLLLEKRNIALVLFQWVVLVVLFVGISGIALLRDYMNYGYIQHNNLVFFISMCIAFFRTSFFGSRIGR